MYSIGFERLTLYNSTNMILNCELNIQMNMDKYLICALYKCDTGVLLRQSSNIDKQRNR